jgi:hypothetical protein
VTAKVSSTGSAAVGSFTGLGGLLMSQQ